jgi:hypothetical protein
VAQVAQRVIDALHQWGADLKQQGASWREELVVGGIDAEVDFKRSLAAGADKVQAHGMRKKSAGGSLQDLLSILNGGSGIHLLTAPLDISADKKAGAEWLIGRDRSYS